LNESDPALLGFTLDTYWVQHGGLDVVQLIRKLKGRIDVCHFKDMAIVNNEQRYAAVGQGNLNFPAILAAFDEIGMKYAFVEQDECYGVDPLDELAKSFTYLMK
jgi:sugar phosphate isomerase/epimerase